MIDAILPKEKVDLKIDCSLINLRTVPKSFSGLKIGQIRFLEAAVLSITCAYPIMKSYCLLEKTDRSVCLKSMKRSESGNSCQITSRKCVKKAISLSDPSLKRGERKENGF